MSRQIIPSHLRRLTLCAEWNVKWSMYRSSHTKPTYQRPHRSDPALDITTDRSYLLDCQQNCHLTRPTSESHSICGRFRMTSLNFTLQHFYVLCHSCLHRAGNFQRSVYCIPVETSPISRSIEQKEFKKNSYSALKYGFTV